MVTEKMINKQLYNIYKYCKFDKKAKKYNFESYFKTFQEFKKWAFDNGYEYGFRLIRFNTKKDYSFDNIFFGTDGERQRILARNNLVYGKALKEWSRILGFEHMYKTVESRLFLYGFSFYDALTKPIQQGKNKGKIPVPNFKYEMLNNYSEYIIEEFDV